MHFKRSFLRRNYHLLENNTINVNTFLLLCQDSNKEIVKIE